MFRRALPIVATIAAAIVLALQAGCSSGETARTAPVITVNHLTLRPGVSATPARPGATIALTLDVTPGERIHVYAPGQANYISIALKLDASADYTKTTLARFPAPRDFFFAPLNETVKVFDQPFRISQDVTIATTPDLERRAAAREQLSVLGTLDYQACDDAVCYRPESVPVQWSMALQPIERE